MVEGGGGERGRVVMAGSSERFATLVRGQAARLRSKRAGYWVLATTKGVLPTSTKGCDVRGRCRNNPTTHNPTTQTNPAPPRVAYLVGQRCEAGVAARSDRVKIDEHGDEAPPAARR